MTQKPETLCTGCGATVTRFVDERRPDEIGYKDVTGSFYCEPTAGDKTYPEHLHKVELPPVDYPPIPDYIREPIVFRDANLGVAMVGTWSDQQWIFAVHPAGKWITIRRANSSDPLFIDPINKAACPGCESENAPHLTSCRVPRKPSKFDPSCETTQAMPVSHELPPVAIKPEATLTPLEKELLAALAIAESTLASCYRIQFAQGVSKMADGDDNWVLKTIRAAIAKAKAVQA